MHLKIFLLILFVTIYSVRSFSPKIHHNNHQQQQQQQQHNIKHKLPPNNRTKHLKTEIVGHNKHNPASRHGHALLQKVQVQLNNDGWANEDANQTLVLLSSLLAIECHMIKLDKKRAKDSAEIKHLTEQICAAENKEQIGIHKLINEVANTFKDGKKMVKQMKRDEHTVKVHLDGHYGTLAEILPSAKKHAETTRLRTYHAVLQLLHLITPKLEEGPAKEAMRKMIKKDTVEGSTVMPSELVGLSMSIWSQFIRENHEAIKEIEIGSQHEHRNHPRRQRRRLPVPPNLVQHALAIAMLFFLLCLATLATGGSGQMTVLNIGILLIAAVAVDQIANSARRRVGKSEAQQHLAMNTMPTMGVEDHQMMIERMGKMREDRREGEGIENEQNIMANEAVDREEGNIMANVPTNEAADREGGNIMANLEQLPRTIEQVPQTPREMDETPKEMGETPKDHKQMPRELNEEVAKTPRDAYDIQQYLDQLPRTIEDVPETPREMNVMPETLKETGETPKDPRQMPIDLDNAQQELNQLPIENAPEKPREMDGMPRAETMGMFGIMPKELQKKPKKTRKMSLPEQLAIPPKDLEGMQSEHVDTPRPDQKYIPDMEFMKYRTPYGIETLKVDDNKQEEKAEKVEEKEEKVEEKEEMEEMAEKHKESEERGEEFEEEEEKRREMEEETEEKEEKRKWPADEMVEKEEKREWTEKDLEEMEENDEKPVEEDPEEENMEKTESNEKELDETEEKQEENEEKEEMAEEMKEEEEEMEQVAEEEEKLEFKANEMEEKKEKTERKEKEEEEKEEKSKSDH